MSEVKPDKFAVDEKLARFQDLYVKQETGPDGLTDDEEKELIDLYSAYLAGSSNGKTIASKTIDVGSIPSLAAKKD